MIILTATAAVVIVLVVLLVVGSKAGIEKGGEDVIKKVYVYLVLFATLMMTIGGSVAAFMALADIVSPAVYYQSFEEYKRYGYPEKISGDAKNEAQLSGEELMARYQAMVVSEKERQVQRAKNNLIKSLGWIVIPLPVFIYFQRQLPKKED